ncbi:MAG: caspase family protein [Reichenbachiella sp.]|uniref:caspase family protein n=1 Tax=Reichenbachiella sp. TaxID=2184521 RepID=UPI003296E6A5
MKDYLLNTVIALILLSIHAADAQNLKSKSVAFDVNLTDSKNLKSGSVPFIEWIEPANETVFLTEKKLFSKLKISSSSSISSVKLNLHEHTDANMRGFVAKDASLRGSMSVKPEENQQQEMTIERDITMMDGINVLEVVVENVDGVVSKSFRIVHVGETALADAAKLHRKDRAVFFLSDNFDNWSDLVNPIYDGRTIASMLEKYYGFEIELIENPSQDVIFSKLREYSEMEYAPLDQLMVFFAGHGYFDEGFKEGFVVVKESLKDDPGKTSYVSYNRLRNILNVIPSEHVFLMMDVCFGGTFDNAIATSRSAEIYEEVSQSDYILRKLSVKTRKYLTSGGKEYVSDGIPGKHSPFAKNVVDALNSFGGSDGILTLNEIYSYVEKLTPEPRIGKFGDNAPGSEFVFVVK